MSEIIDKLNYMKETKERLRTKLGLPESTPFRDFESAIPVIPEVTTRPLDWLTLPTLTGERADALVMVHPTNNSRVSISARGNYSVNWGDGSPVQNLNEGVQVEHTYLWSSVPESSLNSEGYRQAILSITPQVGQLLTMVFFSEPGAASAFTAQVPPPLINITTFPESTGIMGPLQYSLGQDIPGFLLSGNETFTYVAQQVGAYDLSVTNSVNLSINQIGDDSNALSFTVSPNVAAIDNGPIVYIDYNLYTLKDQGSQDLLTEAGFTCSGDTSSGFSCYANTPGAHSITADMGTVLTILKEGIDPLGPIPGPIVEVQAIGVNLTNLGASSTRLRSFILGTNNISNFQFTNSMLERTAILEIFNKLKGSGTNQVITLTGNPGARLLTTEDLAITTAKRWVVNK